MYLVYTVVATNLHEVDFVDDEDDFVEDTSVESSQRNTQESSKQDDMDEEFKDPVDKEHLNSSGNVTYTNKF